MTVKTEEQLKIEKPIDLKDRLLVKAVKKETDAEGKAVSKNIEAVFKPRYMRIDIDTPEKGGKFFVEVEKGKTVYGLTQHSQMRFSERKGQAEPDVMLHATIAENLSRNMGGALRELYKDAPIYLTAAKNMQKDMEDGEKSGKVDKNTFIGRELNVSMIIENGKIVEWGPTKYWNSFRLYESNEGGVGLLIKPEVIRTQKLGDSKMADVISLAFNEVTKNYTHKVKELLDVAEKMMENVTVAEFVKEKLPPFSRQLLSD